MEAFPRGCGRVGWCTGALWLSGRPQGFAWYRMRVQPTGLPVLHVAACPRGTVAEAPAHTASTALPLSWGRCETRAHRSALPHRRSLVCLPTRNCPPTTNPPTADTRALPPSLPTSLFPQAFLSQQGVDPATCHRVLHIISRVGFKEELARQQGDGGQGVVQQGEGEGTDAELDLQARIVQDADRCVAECV